MKKNVKGLNGKLTATIIDRLQNYFGIAVRTNAGDLEGMKKAIHASLFYVASTKDNEWHYHCPEGASSWCRYQSDKATGLSTYKPGKGLPKDILLQHVKPIFKDLSEPELLKRCLHGNAQNQNEAFNALIWERLPKTKYVSLKQLRFGTYDAIAHFNIGRKSSCLIMEKLGMIPGKYMNKSCQMINRKRLYHSNYKSSEKARKRRKVIRGSKKSVQDLQDETEGKMHEVGGF